MKKAVRLFCALTLLVSSSCGPQNKKVAEGAVDADTVIVNRIQETKNAKGETEYIGEVALVQNPGSQEELEERAMNDDFDFMTEKELAAAGITFSTEEAKEGDLAKSFAWLPFLAVAGFSFLFGRATGIAAENRRDYYSGNGCGSCYNGVAYQSRPMAPYGQVVNETPIYAQVGVEQTVMSKQYNFWR